MCLKKKTNHVLHFKVHSNHLMSNGAITSASWSFYSILNLPKRTCAHVPTRSVKPDVVISLTLHLTLQCTSYCTSTRLFYHKIAAVQVQIQIYSWSHQAENYLQPWLLAISYLSRGYYLKSFVQEKRKEANMQVKTFWALVGWTD